MLSAPMTPAARIFVFIVRFSPPGGRWPAGPAVGRPLDGGAGASSATLRPVGPRLALDLRSASVTSLAASAPTRSMP
jgi:hypothetical protein